MMSAGSSADWVLVVQLIFCGFWMVASAIFHPHLLAWACVTAIVFVGRDVWLVVGSEEELALELLQYGSLILYVPVLSILVAIRYRTRRWLSSARLEELSLKAVLPRDRADYLTLINPPQLRPDTVPYQKCKVWPSIGCCAHCGELSAAGIAVTSSSFDGPLARVRSPMAAQLSPLPESRRFGEMRRLSSSEMEEMEGVGDDESDAQSQGSRRSSSFSTSRSRPTSATHLQSPVPVIQNASGAALGASHIQASKSVAECGCNVRVGAASVTVNRRVFAVGGHPDRFRVDVFDHDRREWRDLASKGDAPASVILCWSMHYCMFLAV